MLTVSRKELVVDESLYLHIRLACLLLIHIAGRGWRLDNIVRRDLLDQGGWALVHEPSLRDVEELGEIGIGLFQYSHTQVGAYLRIHDA